MWRGDEELSVEIHRLREFEGCDYGWWCRGHVSPEEFCAAVRDYEGTFPVRFDGRHHPPLPVSTAVHQHYYRCVPLRFEGEVYCMMHYPTHKPGRGAFAVTELEWSECDAAAPAAPAQEESNG